MFPWGNLSVHQFWSRHAESVVVRHHEVFPGDNVNLSELLKTLMSHEILAKKLLAFMWGAHPLLPLRQAVPPQNNNPSWLAGV